MNTAIKICVDFNNADSGGRVRLNTKGSDESLRTTGIIQFSRYENLYSKKYSRMDKRPIYPNRNALLKEASSYIGLIIVLYSLFIYSCSSKPCYKEFIINGKFIDLPGIEIGEKSEYRFEDTIQTSYVNDTLYARAAILWRSCNAYSLVIRKGNFNSPLKIGDTLNVEIIARNKDTFFYRATALGVTMTSKFLKIQ